MSIINFGGALSMIGPAENVEQRKAAVSAQGLVAA
jgi:hypothetical protein